MTSQHTIDPGVHQSTINNPPIHQEGTREGQIDTSS